MFPCILPYVVCCSAIVFLWMWGASGVCLALRVCVVVGVLVRSAYVETRGQLWVSGHRCLFETPFFDLEHHVDPVTLPIVLLDPSVSISIPSWDYIESRCSQLFIWYPSIYPQVVYRLTIPQPLICSLVPFGCLCLWAFLYRLGGLHSNRTL